MGLDDRRLEVVKFGETCLYVRGDLHRLPSGLPRLQVLHLVLVSHISHAVVDELLLLFLRVDRKVLNGWELLWLRGRC